MTTTTKDGLIVLNEASKLIERERWELIDAVQRLTAERDEALRGEEAATAIRAAICEAGAHEGEAYVDAVKRIAGERDEAQKMVAELRRLLSRAHQAVVHEAVTDDDAEKLSGEIDAALSSTADVAGRWVSKVEADWAVTAATTALGSVIKERDMVAERDAFDAKCGVLSMQVEEALAERDAAIARAEKAEAEVEKLRTLAVKVDAIRNSIVGMQGFNFSEHGYPLVAALNEAGYPGLDYKIARENLGTLIEQRDAAERQRDEWKARAEKAIELAVDVATDENSVVNVLARCKALVERTERQRDELGIQYEAQRARLKLFEEGIQLLCNISDDVTAVPAGFEHHYLVEKALIDVTVGSYLARLDALPGDALARPDIGPALDRAHEASGVVVKP